MKISVVTTLFYSDLYIREFYQRVMKEIKKISSDYEIVFVNDGSPDKSKETVLELQTADHHIVVVDLSRNFGHHRAMMTGLQFAEGDYIFLIDSDLEEDPEIFSLLWEKLEASPELDMVYGIQQKRKGGYFERASGNIYYKLFYYIAGFEYPSDTLTARIMSRRYIDGLKTFREKEVDLWGLFMLNGFKQEGILVHKKHKGTSTYTFRRKMKLAIDAIVSLTSRPLYFIFFLGIIISSISFFNILWILYRKIIHHKEVEILSGILASVWFIGGIIMFTLGIISIYLSRIFLEVKNRPLSVIKQVYKI
ncbi:MAG: glycosyltransferase family 2 protein [Chitinophagaceae bacterium]